MDSVESVQRISADGESDLDGQSDDSGPFWDGKDMDNVGRGAHSTVDSILASHAAAQGSIFRVSEFFQRCYRDFSTAHYLERVDSAKLNC